jgi:hypothetical protein
MEWSLSSNDRGEVTRHYVDDGVDAAAIIDFRRSLSSKEILLLLGRRLARVEIMSTGVQTLGTGTSVGRAQLSSRGKQFFSMHPRLMRVVEGRLAETRSSRLP